MSRSTIQPRIAIAVSPPLLAGSLASLLGDIAATVVVLDAPTTDRFDLALVTADGPAVAADIAVVLANGPDGTAVATVTAADRPAVRLEGLAAIVGFVRRWSDAAGHPVAVDGG